MPAAVAPTSLSRPDLTEKRKASVKAFDEYLRLADTNALAQIAHAFENQEHLNFKLQKKFVHIKPNTPTWVNLLVAHDDVFHTDLFSQLFASGTVNNKGNFLRGPRSSDDESTKNAKNAKTNKSKTLTKKAGPRIATFKIGKTVMKLTGDLTRLQDAIQDLIDDNVIVLKKPETEETKTLNKTTVLSEERVVESDDDVSPPGPSSPKVNALTSPISAGTNDGKRKRTQSETENAGPGRKVNKHRAEPETPKRSKATENVERPKRKRAAKLLKPVEVPDIDEAPDHEDDVDEFIKSKTQELEDFFAQPEEF